MLAFLRAVIGSRFGAAFGLVFLVLIVVAFAGADLGGMGTGNLFNHDSVASVGATAISSTEVEKTVRTAFDSERQRSPTLTMKDFLAQGVVDEVVTGLIDRAATWEWGHKHGFGVSDRLIDSEIAKLPAFQGPDGKFSQEAYTQLLKSRGLSDKLVRDDIAKGLMTRLVFAGTGEGAVMPLGLGMTYAALEKELRQGNLLFLPSAAFAPKTLPTDHQIGAFYRANVARYNRAERRTVRYAVIDDAVLKTVFVPGEADIRKRYHADAALYAPRETRSITQVILPTESAAKAFAAELGAGKAIAAAAIAKGLAPSSFADKTRDQIATDSGRAVADAVFAAKAGGVTAPAKGTLGWIVARVDAVRNNPGKTFEQARAAIATALTAERRKAALTDFATQIGEKVEAGASLPDVAKAFGLTVITTGAVIADGTEPGQPAAKPATDLQPLLATAFGMEREGQPQIAALPGGARFALFDVGTITAATPAPLAEVKAQVASDWMRQQGAAAAGAAADKILAALTAKTPLATAVHELGVALPPVNPLAYTREQVAQMKDRVPAPVAQMFAMRLGTAHKLAAPNQAGWVVVTLDTITPGSVAPNDPTLAAASSTLGKVLAREYEQQLRTAIAREIGSKRNAAAIRTLGASLSGAQ